MKHAYALVSLACLLSLPTLAGHVTRSLDEGPKLDVEYGPTPPRVVEEMLNIGRVESGDVVYDLGCGDGRVVIAAAGRGARGVGVDVDPARVEQSRKNAARARVTDRVEFLEQDLFDTDIGEATVVMLFLSPEVNISLRPKLLGELKPGTRVVSHHHDMGLWKPDWESKVGWHPVYCWTVPADAAGTWEWTLDLPGGGMETWRLRVARTFQVVDIEATADGVRSEAASAQLSGATVEFTLHRREEGVVVPVRFRGIISGDAVSGEMLFAGGRFRGARPWHARRTDAGVAGLRAPARR